jgi:hypothetical protein
MQTERYWIVVVSKDHVKRGVKDGFMQANHGKASSLKKLTTGDWVIFYSPKQSYAGNEPLQAFTAIGQVTDDGPYQYKMTEDFIPYRRNVDFYECKETPIIPLIGKLEFIENKKAWGFKFRFGFFEIQQHDFELICSNMIINEPTLTHQLN